MRLIAGSLLLAGLAISALEPASAGQKKPDQEKKKDGPLKKGTTDDNEKSLRLEGTLSKDDPRDRVLKDSHYKIHPFAMKAGRLYRLDLTSKDFPPFLRLEDPEGKVLAEDDNGLGTGSRILFKPEKDGDYRIVVSSFKARATGKYSLNVVPANAVDTLEYRAREFGRSNPGQQKKFVEDLTKHLEQKKADLTLVEGDIARQTGMILENQSRDRAAEVYDTFAKLLAFSSHKEVAAQARTLEGAARRLRLSGKAMELKGKSLTGKAIDLKDLRGKVVLVDFWATWCPPCRAEIPHLRKLYETYHKRGFEVVAISLDQDKLDLVRFLDKNKLPWTSLWDRLPENGLGDYYGIFYIPQAFLVDREGRVISTAAHGAELARLLEKHIGAGKD